jgi:hypothetical protein
MSRNYLVAGACVVVAGIVMALWYLDTFNLGAKGQSASAAAPYVVPPIQETYTNVALGFSLGLPDGFTAQESEEENGVKTVVLQDSEGNGIQILATPLKEDIPHLSIERVKRDIPDMKVSDVQSVEIGENRTGVAFMSDNEAFGGASREVWFTFRGHLYQISTYARLDELLQSMFASWTFI